MRTKKKRKKEKKNSLTEETLTKRIGSPSHRVMKINL